MSPRKSGPPKTDAVAKIRESLDEQRKDEADQRQLRGKHAPPEGVCRSAVAIPSLDGEPAGYTAQPCGGRVVPLVRFPVQNLIGGTPPNAYVAYWHCEECGLMYHAPPKSRS